MSQFVIIPAYNEEKYLSQVIQKAKHHSSNIVVVDDGSSDNTYNLATQTGVTVIHHATNLGKGAALKTGCDYACRKGASKIVVLDADTQHDPDLIPEFASKLPEYDIIFGYRQLSKNMPSILRFGNQVINSITSFLYGFQLKDTQCGYRAFTCEAYYKIRWQALDYCMESEMIARAGKHKLKYTQIPIQTIYADKYKGTTVIDGIKIVLKLITWRLSK